MSRKKIWEAYYLTHFLLTDFQTTGGICSMEAEEELFYLLLDFLDKKRTEKQVLEEIDCYFGLTKHNLTRAIKDYEKYERRVL